MNLFRLIYNLFDRLEDHVRGWFSHFPILYALVGGVGVVVFWRGVWHTADYLMARMTVWNLGPSSVDLESMLWWDGPLSLVVGTTVLLMTGVFVSNFIGNEIILTGLRGEKKLTEKTERELRTEVGAIAEIRDETRAISQRLENLERTLATQKKQ